MREILVCLPVTLAVLLGSYLAPVQAQVPVVKGTNKPAPDSGKVKVFLPRVLLIGDSISMGYTEPVRKLLTGVADVRRIPTNGGPTTRGIAEIENWLGDDKWDVIHFNWGLHDLKFVDANGKNTSVDKGQRQVPPEAYEKNLTQLVERLKKTGAKLIWCSTTPVPQGAASRVPGDEIEYNRIAEKVMQAHGIPINDLHRYAADHVPTKPRDVHYTPDGSHRLAEKVANAIRQQLDAAPQK
jgi:acyl-CoA thioesterase-1